MFLIFTSLFCIFAFPISVLARAGGGGSGGGFNGSGASGGGSGGGLVGIIGFAVIFIVVVVVGIIQRRKKIKQAKEAVFKAAATDGTWTHSILTDRARDVFLQFQKDWSDFNVEAMKEYLTTDFYKKMVLEMNVLKNFWRQNLVNSPKIQSINVIEAKDDLDNSRDTFTAEIIARADDVLMNTYHKVPLYKDSSYFTEYWVFTRDGEKWLLGRIKQSTENPNLIERAIINFSDKNNFFYDPDFGWLMMPNAGAIFSKTDFKTSDINNHVIGYYRDKIVEFYTYRRLRGWRPRGGLVQASQYISYTVAQAILPIRYNDILVRRKKWLWNPAPRGLRRIKTESVDFNNKFCLFAAPGDHISSFELLSPDFMEKIYHLGFVLNIEVVGNVLYLYYPGTSSADYDKMLEILSWAFDDMKM